MKTNPNHSIQQEVIDHDGPGVGCTTRTTGLTKREYFVAMALQGTLSSWKSHRLEGAVKFVLNAADLLIEKLNKEKS